MKLPKIEEDQSPFNADYIEVILSKKQKKIPGTKISYDWKTAQLNLQTSIKQDQKLISSLIQLQKMYIENQVPMFYSYFVVKHIITTENSLSVIQQQLQKIKSKQSSYHKITNLIKIRENLHQQLHQLAAMKDNRIYQKIDDMRFINLEIIKMIRNWKRSIYPMEEPVIFLYNGDNYLVKIIRDNVEIIQYMNRWKQKLIYPPNPFYLNENGSYQGMTQNQKEQMEECMQILAKQKAEELKCIINPPKYILKYVPKNQQNELNKLRGQLQNQKNQQISNIYTPINRKQAQPKSRTKMIEYYQQKGREKRKYHSNVMPNPLEAMIKTSEVSVLKAAKSKKVEMRSSLKNFNTQKQKQKMIKSQYQFKIDSLRNKVESKSIQDGKMKSIIQQSLKRVKPIEVKTTKPKIKLLGQKQVSFQSIVKVILPSKNLEMYKKDSLKKSTSSFFKNMEKIEQVNEEHAEIQIKPITQKHNRSMSTSFLNNLKPKSPPIKRASLYLFSNSQLIKSVYNKKKKQKSQSSLEVGKNHRTKALKTQEDQLNKSNLNHSNVDQSLRIVKGRLRQLAIRKIYQHKQKSPPNRETPFKRNLSPKTSYFKHQQNKEIQSVKPEKHHSLKKLYQSTFINKSKVNIRNIKNPLKQKKKQDQQKYSNNYEIDEQLIRKKSTIVNLQIQLAQKEAKIQMLADQLKQQSNNNKDIQFKKVQAQIQMKRQQINKQKLEMQLKQKIITEKMKQEEKRFFQLKQQQYKIRQQQIKNKYEKDIELAKAQYLKKQKQMQRKIFEEEQKRKENQLKLIQENKKMQALKRDIQEKHMKEQLLNQIIKERENRNIDQQQNNAEQIKRQLQQQLKAREQIEKQGLKELEEENNNLVKMYEEMTKRNEKMFSQNQKMIKKIQELALEKAQEQQKLVLLEKTFKTQELQRQQNIEYQNEIKQIKAQRQQEEDDENQEARLEQLKLRVKQEILRQMIKKKQKEEQEQKLYQKERRQKVKKLEEQIKESFRKQEQQLNRITADKQKLKSKQKENQISKQGGKSEQNPQKQQQQSKQQQENINHKNQQRENILQNDHKNQNLQLFNTENANKQEKEQLHQQTKILINEEQDNQSNTQQINQKKSEKEQYPLEKVPQKQISQQFKQEKKQSKIQQSKHNQQKQSNKQKNQQSNLNQLKQQSNKQKLPISKGQILQQSKITHKKEVKQNSEEMMNKYKILKQHFIKCKQIYIEDFKVKDWINSFYQQFQVQVKQMLPYSKQQLVQIILNKKVDIFDCSSVGWLDHDKYILLGNIGCVDLVIKKYGQIQIQNRYIFNKNSPYQKQFLAKKIKLYEQIGYVYQKKIAGDSKYSIKFILKIPKDVVSKNIKRPGQIVFINSVVSIERHSAAQSQFIESNHGVEYLLSQTLNNNLSAQQKADFIAKTDIISKSISKRMYDKTFISNQVNTNHVDDSKTQLQMKISLPYIQFYDNPCYVLKLTQYVVNQTEKIYIYKLSSSMSIVIVQGDYNKDFTLETYLQSKIRNLTKQRQLILCIPIWEFNRSFKLNTGSFKEYIYREQVRAHLNFGSILNTSIKKEDYKLLQSPFLFTIYERNQVDTLVRPLWGTIVTKNDNIKLKR